MHRLPERAGRNSSSVLLFPPAHHECSRGGWHEDGKHLDRQREPDGRELDLRREDDSPLQLHLEAEQYHM